MQDFSGIGFVLNIIDKICLGIFSIELALRLFAFGLAFFTDKNQRGWNLFYFIIVAVSLLVESEMSILRSLRIFRVLRLVSIFSQMRLITEAMLHTLPSLASVVVLILVFFYMYGVLCVNLFGEAFPQFFGNLGVSFYTLFQVMTLDGWRSMVALPIMAVYPYAWIVFVSFIIIISYMVLNLVIGIVVEAIAEIKGRDRR
ncbi:ion transporter [Helicobacter sp. T3_23-1059]